MSHGRQEPCSASPANMSKRGLFTRLSAPNQTLILVKARLPKGNSGAGNGANPASYGVGLSSRGPFRELARPLPCKRPRGAANPSSFRADGSRECAPDDRLREAIHLAAQKSRMDSFVVSAPRNHVVGSEVRQWSFNPFHSSSPDSTGRSSIPETVVIEPRGRGVLGPPLSRRTTARVWCLRCRFQA